MKRTFIGNWSGSVGFSPEEIRYPASRDEIIRIVREAVRKNLKVRAIGAGHSFTALIETGGMVVSLDRYQGIDEADTRTRTAMVRGGTRLYTLGPALHKLGLAQEALGDIDRQSIAGAVSTGTHGTGIGFGSISTQVLALTLITAAGETLECSDKKNTEVFNAVRVSLGSMGIISDIRLRLVPAYNLHFVQRRETLDGCLRNLPEYIHGNRHFEFFYFPYTDAAQTKFVNESALPADRSFFRYFLNDIVLENWAFGLLSAISRAVPPLTVSIAGLLGTGISGLEKINSSYKIFSVPRMVPFNEMEYALPIGSAADVIREIDARIRRERFRVHFPVECRFVKADDIYLSPAYRRDSALIAVHMYKGMPYREYFDAIEEIFIRYGGRPHWGKMHTRKAADLGKLYPKWKDFNRIRRRLDPGGVFMNEYLGELFDGKR